MNYTCQGYKIQDTQVFSSGDLAYAVRKFRKACFPDQEESGKITGFDPSNQKDGAII